MYFLYSFKVNRFLSSAANSSILNIYGVLHKSDTIDAIDVFTSNLIKTKHNKWDKFKSADKCNTTTRVTEEIPNHPKNINILTINQINNIVKKLKQQKNFKELSLLINQCTESNKLIGSNSIALITNEVTSNHNEPHINSLLQYFTILEDQLILDAKYYYIIIEFYWDKGYYKKCLDLLTELYQKHNGFDKVCTNFIRYTIIDKIDEKSEAILIFVIKFCETIADKHNDFNVMALIWFKCMKSDQFIDHKFALQLFEKHSMLRNLVLKNINSVSSSLLYVHNIDAIYRLIEILLKHDLKHECDPVLISLFEYHCECSDYLCILLFYLINLYFIFFKFGVKMLRLALKY